MNTIEKLVKEQRDRFNRSFRQQGFSLQSRRMALDVFEVLIRLDERLFPHKPAAIHLCTERIGKHGTVANYCKPHPRSKEHFTIFVAHIADGWRHHRDSVFLRETRKGVQVIPEAKRHKLDEMEYAFAVAAHEMRHRLQYWRKNTLRTFNPWTDRKVMSPILKVLCQVMRVFMRQLRKDLRGQKASRKKIKQLTRSTEFDALVVECLVAHRLRRITSIGDLAQLVSVNVDDHI